MGLEGAEIWDNAVEAITMKGFNGLIFSKNLTDGLPCGRISRGRSQALIISIVLKNREPKPVEINDAGTRTSTRGESIFKRNKDGSMAEGSASDDET